jgi:hypothetical protein
MRSYLVYLAFEDGKENFTEIQVCANQVEVNQLTGTLMFLVNDENGLPTRCVAAFTEWIYFGTEEEEEEDD